MFKAEARESECESVPQLYLTLRPHALQPARLFSPWNFLGKNTGVGRHSLLQGEGSILTQGSNLGLLHGRLILYHLSHQGSPENKVFAEISRTDHRFRPLLGAISADSTRRATDDPLLPGSPENTPQRNS